MRALILFVSWCLCGELPAHAPRPSREPRATPSQRVDYIADDRGRIEVWRWGADYRGRTRLVITEPGGRVLRVFIFEVPLR